MARYGMRGTPTLLLIDAEGHLRDQHFGHIDDLRLGAEIARLIVESTATPDLNARSTPSASTTCRLPAM